MKNATISNELTIAEVGDFSWFRTATDFAAYVRLLQGEHLQRSKGASPWDSKTGNIDVRKFQVEAA